MPKAFATLTSMLALTWATGAVAQVSASAAAAATPADGAMVDEVVVTAQRRSERLVDVPISVATASADDLQRAGPSSIENLTKVTPGIYFQRAVYGLAPTVRGIGSTLSAAGGEQNVALYVDEVYQPTPTGNVFDVASIAGVEVLKGPQGTLFGRNATGGAILLRTLDPGFDVAARVNLSYERFDTFRGSAYLNVPVNDTIAFNGTVAYRDSGGYVRDLKTDDITYKGHDFNIRGKLLVQPSDDVSIVLAVSHYDFDDPTGVDTKNLKPARLITALGGGPVAMDRFHSSNNTDQFIRTSGEQYSGHAKVNIAGGTVSWITAYQINRLDSLNEIDLSYINTLVDVKVRTKVFTQEVNFASAPDGPLTYVAGLFYYHSDGVVPFFRSQVLTPAPTPLYNSEGKINALAGYADGTYTFGNWSLIAGLRYSYEKRESASAFGVARPSPFTRFQEDTDKELTPRVGLRYALAEDTNIYATYSRGFKSGVFDSTSPTGPAVKPETVDAFEVGLKSAGPTFSYNAAAFYYDYKDTQANATLQIGDAVQNQLVNVPKARIYGAEVDANLRLNENFDLRAAAAYTHARYIDFKNAPGWADLGGLTFVGVPVDASGKHMVRAPEFTASATLSYHTLLWADKELEVTVSPYYSSRVYFVFDNSLSQDPYVTVDAAAALTLSENLKVSVFGRNLTDRVYKIYESQLALSLNGAKYATPRTFGVSLNYSY